MAGTTRDPRLSSERRETTAPGRTVMAVYDGSEPSHRALQHAADLVGVGGTLTVINVISVQRVGSRLETVSEQERATQDNLVAEADGLLRRMGVEADIVRAAGDPATEILSAAESLGADVIVVGRRRKMAPHLIHGSLSSTLVRKAACDVLVVH